MRTIYRTGFPIEQSGAESLKEISKSCLAWALSRPEIHRDKHALINDSLRSLPLTAVGSGHEIETRLIHTSTHRAWAMRFTHPHREFKQVDEKIKWQTEIGISEKGSSITFCCSISVGRNDSAVAPLRIFPTRPRVVLELLKKFDCGGKVRLSEKAYVLKDTPDEAHLFRTLLESNSRQHPVVFITPRVPNGDYAVDHAVIASELAGLAYVVVANCPEATRTLGNELPAQLNCYDGGVRVYWPGFNVSQSPFTHPLWLWWKIKQFQDRHPSAFAKELLKQIASVAVLSLHPDWLTWSGVDAFERTQAIERAKSAGDTEELLNLYVKDEEALEGLVSQLRTEIESKSKDLQITQAKINAYEAAFEKLKREGTNQEPESDLIPPSNVQQAVEKAKKLFDGRLVFPLNAKSEVEGNQFEEPEELFEALSWLANAYYDSKSGAKSGTPLRDSIKETLSDWFYSGGQSDQTMGEFKDWYRCQFEKQKWELGEHIGTGSSKDARHTIRLGFTWDKEGKRVIIGFIGQHQRSRKT